MMDNDHALDADTCGFTLRSATMQRHSPLVAGSFRKSQGFR